MLKRALATSLAVLTLATPALSHESEEREGGIIGTGIVGTITALGSIYVNGQHIRLDESLPVAGSVPQISAADLRPGQTVAVIAEIAGTDWQARHIRQVLPLVGPVSTVEGGELVVMGVRVGMPDAGADIAAGDWVAVNGLWRGARVQASLVQRLETAPAYAQISGSYFGTDEDGNQLIGPAALRDLPIRHLQAGDLVRVQGAPLADGISGTRLETGLFDQNVGLIQVEGYFSPPRPDGLYTLLGSGLVAYTDRPEMIAQDSRVIECGHARALGELPDQIKAKGAAEALGCKE